MSRLTNFLVPPFRFGQVENGVYRGGYPKTRNFPFLKRLKLKVIISLIPNEPNEDLKEFCSAENISHIFIPVDLPDDNVTLTSQVVSKSLQIITDPANNPVYYHCMNGSNVSGLLSMCLRKLQLWIQHSYEIEFIRFERNGELISDETDFVDEYKGADLILSNPYALWLWPHLNLKHNTENNIILPFTKNAHPTLPKLKLSKPKEPYPKSDKKELVSSTEPTENALADFPLILDGNTLDRKPTDVQLRSRDYESLASKSTSDIFKESKARSISSNLDENSDPKNKSYTKDIVSITKTITSTKLTSHLNHMATNLKRKTHFVAEPKPTSQFINNVVARALKISLEKFPEIPTLKQELDPKLIKTIGDTLFSHKDLLLNQALEDIYTRLSMTYSDLHAFVPDNSSIDNTFDFKKSFSHKELYLNPVSENYLINSAQNDYEMLERILDMVDNITLSPLIDALSLEGLGA
ncbi:putative tyrosine-protein phosphatase [Smittium mucronatum]|uniref:Putative tyrosine-protein phosphatase n=1 Tax=Smittium mucronatum TaxID=133383 RepID=A0A1R0H696_9FUNG|nr:putative tyrosine-protein phosphatase [Smittium mucronatum]